MLIKENLSLKGQNQTNILKNIVTNCFLTF